MEIGIYTFGDHGTDLVTGESISAQQRMRNLIEEARLADEVGLDFFGLGEHHRHEYLVSAPTVALAAIAERTERIRLSTAVTVLSSDDPVRVLEQFNTLDLISDGRAEIMAGRGSFTESFPLFGYDLEDYDELFLEKLELLIKLREAQAPLTWEGRMRPPLRDAVIHPPSVQQPIPLWIAVGGNPESVVRAGALGLPLSVAIIGGLPARFRELVKLYREAGDRAGQPAERLKVAIASIGWIADDGDAARARFYPGYAAMMTQLGRERGWGPMTPPAFEQMAGPAGALLVGDPEQVAQKILYEHQLFSNDRFAVQFGGGALPHAEMLRAIELLGTKVAPLVREEVGKRKAAAPA